MFEERATDANVRLRFVAELRAHEERVHALVHGTMSPALRARASALELLGLTGAASVLGLSGANEIAGRLGDALATCDRDLGHGFWSDFDRWFSLMCDHLCALLANRISPVSAAHLIQQRGRLELQVSRAGTSTASTPSLSVSAGRRILFVDDSPTTRAVVLATLADCGYLVRVAQDLKEAASLLSDFEPELVITDVQLPEVAGDEICRRIKATVRHLVPIVLYSSLPDVELSRRAKAAGADACVGKHHGIQELLRCIDTMFAEEVLF